MNKKAVIGATAAAIVVIIGAVAFTQGARLKAAASVAKSATMNDEQTTAKSDENTQITQEIQDQYQIPEIALTPELQAAIADGTMTVEEAAAQLLSGGDASQTAEAVEETRTPDANAQTETSAQETPEPTEETPQAEPSAQVEETPEPPKQTEETPAKTAEETPKAEPSKPVEETPAKAAEEAPKAQTQAPETASLSGQTDSGQTQAATDAGQSKAADGGQSQAATPADSGQTQAPEKSAAEKAEEERNAKVQSLFAQLYVLRDSFSSRVDGIIAECIEEYLKLDPSKQTKINRIRIVYGRMDDLEAMEADCNAQVENIASQLDEIDPALGEKARQYYQNEKELKKASLIAQYGG